MSETGSQVSWDDFSDSRCVSPALSCDFDINDTSWADNCVSPGSNVTSPEPPSNSSIWARFNSGLSRFTQDLGKTSSAQNTTIPSIEITGDKLADVPRRDDVIEGAEGDTKLEQSETGHWSISASFRKFSLGLSQSGTSAKSYSSDDSDNNSLGNTSKILISSHSSNMLDESFRRSCGEEQGAHGYCRSVSLIADSVTATPTDMTSVLNHSNTGPFTAVTGATSKSTEGGNDELEVGSRSEMLALSLASPARLASKPPLPQRSGTLSPRVSPRDMPSRPRPTHRRSQSLQQFTPTSNLSTMTSKSSVRTDICPAEPATQTDTTQPQPQTGNTPSTHEIYV